MITFVASAAIFAVFSPQELFAAQVPPAIVESIPEMSDRVAMEFSIPTTTLSNLWHSESGGDPDAVGDHGCSYGLTQQNICANPGISKQEALNAETALRLAARDIAEDREERYTVCNCYAFVSTKIENLPKMAQIVPNTSPHVGAVAILDYKDKTTGKAVVHIAMVKNINADGFEVEETNFQKCLHDVRFIRWDDPHLKGFWSKT